MITTNPARVQSAQKGIAMSEEVAQTIADAAELARLRARDVAVRELMHVMRDLMDELIAWRNQFGKPGTVAANRVYLLLKDAESVLDRLAPPLPPPPEAPE